MRTGMTIVLATAAAALTACGPSDTRDEPASQSPPVHVDSILPLEEEVRRFRARVGARVAHFTGSEPGRDALVERFVRALEAADAAALAELALDPAEFIDLYYPHTMYTRKPYELSPSVVWLLISENGRKGLTRLLRRYGGRPLGYRGYTCAEAPRREGPNVVHDGCSVAFAASGRAGPVRLFGSIIERGGRFAFVSFANDL